MPSQVINENLGKSLPNSLAFGLHPVGRRNQIWFLIRLRCSTLFSQLATCSITNKMAEISRERMMSSDWSILTKLRWKLLRRCFTQATCLATLRKVEGRSTILATHNATIAVAKWGVTRDFFLAICKATFVALQVARKIASCNMALTLKEEIFAKLKVFMLSSRNGKPNCVLIRISAQRQISALFQGPRLK